MKLTKSIILFLMIFSSSICMANSEKLDFFDLKFGMSIEDVKNIAEGYRHSFTEHQPIKDIVYCNSSILEWNNRHPRYDYVFLNGKLSRVMIDLPNDCDVVIKKLEDTYGGKACISYRFTDFKQRKSFDKIWKGPASERKNVLSKLKEWPSVYRINDVYYECTLVDYDIRYDIKGSGFVWPGKIIYSIKDFDIIKKEIEKNYEQKINKRKEAEKARQYKDLNL